MLDNPTTALWLLSIPGIGPRTAVNALRRNAACGRSARQMAELSDTVLRHEYGLPKAAAARVRATTGAALEAAANDYADLARRGVQIVSVLDGAYPVRLEERMIEAPPALFVHGALELLNTFTFAVANSNGAPECALAAADAAVAEAVQNGCTLVTGHNRIPYQRTALAARRNAGRTIYVVDRGLLEAFKGDLTNALFPAARIWGPTFDPLTDLAISPFGPRTHGSAGNNRRRDALIIGLADVVLAGHVRPQGAMHGLCIECVQRKGSIFRLVIDDGSSLPDDLAELPVLSAPLRP